MKISKLLLNTCCKTEKFNDIEIDEISIDSKKIFKKENAIYVCLKGENTDGHLFASEAVKNGAKAVLCEYPLGICENEFVVPSTRKALAVIASNLYDNPQEKLKMIAITGTNGKTTTTFMLKSILEAEGKSVGIIGTTGAYIKDKCLKVNLTTPDPVELNKILSAMVENGCEYCALEASAHSLFYDKLYGINFDAGIFSNLTQDHLDFFKNMENYKNAKKKLFNMCKLVVSNVDDEMGKEIIKEAKVASVCYALNSPADCFAIDIVKKTFETKCVFNLFDDVLNVSINLPGEFNVYNALAAATTAKVLGISSDAIKVGLKNLKFVPGRFNTIKLLNGAYAVVDFAHTPDGIEKILTAIKDLKPKRLISVFGCGGNRDKDKRHKMGLIAEKLSDFVVITSDNPRFENPNLIMQDVVRDMKRENYVCVENRKKAVEIALSLSRKGDIVAILGKGGEEYQDINGVKSPYSDYDVVVNFNKKMATLISAIGG